MSDDMDTLARIKAEEAKAESSVKDAEAEAAEEIVTAQAEAKELEIDAEKKAKQSYDAAMRKANADAAKIREEIINGAKDRVKKMKKIGNDEAMKLFDETIAKRFGL